MTAADLMAFETRIADLYAQGKIAAPVHLRAGRERALIDIFEREQIGADDYTLAYWDSHEICLLKGVPPEQVEAAILNGRSISLCFPDYGMICSGIAGSLMGVAVGLAWGIKNHYGHRRVFLFCGDMSAEMGIFHEAVKYAYNFDLPIQFIVSDNGLSVMTPTKQSWGEGSWWNAISCGEVSYKEKIIHFEYTNGFPHSGIDRKVEF